MLKVLVVDDEKGIRMFFEEMLKDSCEVDTAEDGLKGFEKIRDNNYDLVFLDLRMPVMSGIDVLDKVSSLKTDTNAPPYIVVLTAIDDIATVVKCVKMGAYDYIVKPINVGRVEIIINQVKILVSKYKEIDELKKSKDAVVFVGKSEAAREVLSKIEQASKVDVNVIISGESGVGKEIVAKLIHLKSKRRDKKFVPVDCSSFPETLIESELFGYEKGAFTGAYSKKIGKIEYADGGTLFLDEVGNMPLSVQAKLLRFLQERSFTRIGGLKNIEVNIRIISATNVELKKLIENGKFREDLFYRLNVFPIYIPPLRERKEDIPLLIEHFITRYSLVYGKRISFSQKAIKKLMSYNFPGNVRELQNLVLRYLVMSRDGDEIEDVDIELYSEAPYFPKLYSLKEIQDIYISYILKHTGNNITRASKILGVSRRSIYNWLERREKKI
ncbi:MAG: sigma-54 dependent transcriptional regulator [Spirochaetia bacterium]|nr:sigma-54 dependent transcriptional regulator [Spirochaetota bacterium]MCX8097268.1 sigma-54 dependent transcriptional regulator [Spirochaetota bacterium]MDW8111876.1 sigma-54 dependent transcriptional regulator [Spirochaetia bacterium]